MRDHLRHQLLFHLAQISAVVCIIYWWRHLPVPGYAVGVLAVVAAAMSIHRKMRPWQKAVWMLLIGAFLVEFRAIDKDRADYIAAEKSRQTEERKEFQAIADGMSATIASSDRNFAAVMGSTNQVLNNITGGNEYCYVVPGPDRTVEDVPWQLIGPLGIYAYGKSPQSGSPMEDRIPHW